MLALRMALGGAACGYFAGALGGGLIGLIVGALLGNLTLGLDAALFTGAGLALVGGCAGLIFGWSEPEEPPATAEGSSLQASRQAVSETQRPPSDLPPDSPTLPEDSGDYAAVLPRFRSYRRSS